MSITFSKKCTVAALAFALAAPASALELPKPRKSPIDLNEEFSVVPDANVTLTGCTKDGQSFTVRGDIMVSGIEMLKAGKDTVPVASFQRTLQTAYKGAIAKVTSGEYVEGGFTTTGFESVDDALREARIANKKTSGITVVFMPDYYQRLRHCAVK